MIRDTVWPLQTQARRGESRASGRNACVANQGGGSEPGGSRKDVEGGAGHAIVYEELQDYATAGAADSPDPATPSTPARAPGEGVTQNR